MNSKAVQEDFYEAFLNKDSEIMFAVAHRSNIPVQPKIIYDGKEHALFYRTPEDIIILDFLHPEIRKPLRKVTKVLISEVDAEKVVREYEVPLKLVKQLPIDHASIKPLAMI